MKNERTTKKEAGKKGGAALVAKRGPEYMRTIGARGGRKTVAAHGSHHMSAIGYAGAVRTAELYYEGDFGYMMDRLRNMSNAAGHSVWDEAKQCWVKSDPDQAKAARDAAIQNIVAMFTKA